MQVVDLMTTEVIKVSPDTRIQDAARLMFRHRVSGLPVVYVALAVCAASSPRPTSFGSR